MKVFLSLGLSGKTVTEIDYDIKRMSEKILDIMSNIAPNEKIEIVHNADYYPDPEERRGRVYCLGEAIKKMDECELVVFHPDYSKHKGCLVEEKVAQLYGIKRFYLQDVIENGKE